MSYLGEKIYCFVKSRDDIPKMCSLTERII